MSGPGGDLNPLGPARATSLCSRCLPQNYRGALAVFEGRAPCIVRKIVTTCPPLQHPGPRKHPSWDGGLRGRAPHQLLNALVAVGGSSARGALMGELAAGKSSAVTYHCTWARHNERLRRAARSPSRLRAWRRPPRTRTAGRRACMWMEEKIGTRVNRVDETGRHLRHRLSAAASCCRTASPTLTKDRGSRGRGPRRRPYSAGRGHAWRLRGRSGSARCSSFGAEHHRHAARLGLCLWGTVDLARRVGSVGGASPKGAHPCSLPHPDPPRLVRFGHSGCAWSGRKVVTTRPWMRDRRKLDAGAATGDRARVGPAPERAERRPRHRTVRDLLSHMVGLGADAAAMPSPTRDHNAAWTGQSGRDPPPPRWLCRSGSRVAEPCSGSGRPAQHGPPAQSLLIH